MEGLTGSKLWQTATLALASMILGAMVTELSLSPRMAATQSQIQSVTTTLAAYNEQLNSLQREIDAQEKHLEYIDRRLDRVGDESDPK